MDFYRETSPEVFGVVRGSEGSYMEDGFGVAVVNVEVDDRCVSETRITADGTACYSGRISQSGLIECGI